MPLPLNVLVAIAVHWFSGSVRFVEASSQQGQFATPFVAPKIKFVPFIPTEPKPGDGVGDDTMLNVPFVKPLVLQTRLTAGMAGVRFVNAPA